MAKRKTSKGRKPAAKPSPLSPSRRRAAWRGAKAATKPKPKRKAAPKPTAAAAADTKPTPLETNAADLLAMVEAERPWTPPEGAAFHKITHLKKRAFLGAFAVRGTVARAAEDARVTRRTHYNWLKADDDYVKAFGEAREVACDVLESEARRRAVDGVLEPVYWQGELVGYRRAYSDTLLIFLMKGSDPDKWKDRAHVTSDGQLQLSFPDLPGREAAEKTRKQVRRLLSKPDDGNKS